MKIIINPIYKDLSKFIENIPTIFPNEGESIYKERNELKVYSIDGHSIVVKRYKKPHLINRIAYTYFRPSKARRAYEFALKLLDLGVETPAPVAFIEQYKTGLLTYGYFISIYEKDYSDIRDLMEGVIVDDTLLKELSVYISTIHNKGVLHLDMSPGNILYKKHQSKSDFTLIDINRMQFHPVLSLKKRYKSFKRLTENNDVLNKIARCYAQASELDETRTIEQITKYSAKFFVARNRKYKDS